MSFTICMLCAVGCYFAIRFALREYLVWREERRVQEREAQMQRYNIAAFKGTKERQR